jgi:phage shock protein PspC (stress-responsive transcriptional regulator)
MSERAGGTLRRGPDRILGGVCSGLAHYLGVDPLLVRIVFVILALAHGIGILLYFVLWLLMEPPLAGVATGSRSLGDRVRMMGDEIREDFRTGFRSPPADPTPPRPPGEPAAAPPAASGTSHQRGLWLGVLLIALGAYFLLDNLGVFNSFRWDLFWPVVLIAIGLLFLARRR